MNQRLLSSLLFIALFGLANACRSDQARLEMQNLFPWCIVAFDSEKRTPAERIEMIKGMGFTKYAYGWRTEHLDEAAEEIDLCRENGIEIIAVWLWLNAKRDSLGKLGSDNKRILKILDETNLKTTLWVGFNNNYFEGQTQEKSVKEAAQMISFIQSKADSMGCEIALYNHKGWFGDPRNQLEVINALDIDSLTLALNFHHLHDYIDSYPEIIDSILPFVSAVNLNGMTREGSKILTIGQGEYEREMIEVLLKKGYTGPWGILDHIETEDSRTVLKRNIDGLKVLDLMH